MLKCCEFTVLAVSSCAQRRALVSWKINRVFMPSIFAVFRFIATTLSVAVTHRVLISILPGPLRFRYLQLLQFLAIALTSILAFPVAVLYTVFNRRAYINYALGKLYRFFHMSFTRIKCTVQDPHHRLGAEQVIYVANHQNLMDFRGLGETFPPKCVVMAKQDFVWYPFLGWTMMLAKNVFIKRTNTSSALNTMSQSVEQLQNTGYSLWVFPEGTRAHQGGQLLPFKKGAFHMAQQLGCPIVPIVFESFERVYDSRKKVFCPGDIKIRVLDKIDMKGKSVDDVSVIADTCREQMQAVLDEMALDRNKKDMAKTKKDK